MKTVYYYLGMLLFASALTGCKENTALEYENDPCLYFYNGSDRDGFVQKDSAAHTFFVLPNAQMRDTVWIDVCTMGYPEDTDRPFELVLTNADKPNAAVPGKHFVAFDDESIKKYYVLPAGKVRYRMPIIILRDASLNTSTIRFELTIGENAYFKPGINKLAKFVLTTTASAAKPGNWDKGWEYQFGVWGPVKMKFIIDYVGLTDFSVRPSDFGYLSYLAGKAKQKLFEYNQAHPGNELEEADGTPVEFK